MEVYENGAPKIDLQILGFPYNKDPDEVPLISKTPPYFEGLGFRV